MIHPTPRLRFAPSPTGPLHLGGARTAMYNWALARSLGGAFVLRIEDTDRARSTDESLQIILAGLAWLGIDWDEGPEFTAGGRSFGGGDFGPYFQMQRLDRYAALVEQLLASGHAYKCYCTPEELAELRAEQKAAKSSFIGYDGRHRDLTAEQRAEKEAQGIQPNIRFRMPDDEVVRVHDLIRGDVEVNTKQLDDWVMVRPGGVPLYNFACVVDDIDMKITHVVRGEEHFLNGVKQRLLFEALGHECPQYAHIPLILNPKGGKLSKRDPGVKSTLEYRDLGYPAAAVFNYIALLGWGFSADRDVFTRDEMVAAFQIGSVGKAGAKFDVDKLHWMCGEYIRTWSLDDFLTASRGHVEPLLADGAWDANAGFLRNALALFQERVQLLSELPDKLRWLFEDPALDAAAQKNLGKHADAPQWLAAYADLLEGMDLPPSFGGDRAAFDTAVRLPSPEDDAPAAAGALTPNQLGDATRALIAELGIKFGQFVHPVRAALTGTNKGPGFFDCVWLLGKDAAVRRLRAHGRA
ncbi:MAG: glutamate--tRNA ligase [Planctomycetes bacterium]|nr:glutamate--tRNA ligase [Planctomycetota bacterium]